MREIIIQALLNRIMAGQMSVEQVPEVYRDVVVEMMRLND